MIGYYTLLLIFLPLYALVIYDLIKRSDLPTVKKSIAILLIIGFPIFGIAIYHVAYPRPRSRRLNSYTTRKTDIDERE